MLEKEKSLLRMTGVMISEIGGLISKGVGTTCFWRETGASSLGVVILAAGCSSLNSFKFTAGTKTSGIEGCDKSLVTVSATGIPVGPTLLTVSIIFVNR